MQSSAAGREPPSVASRLTPTDVRFVPMSEYLISQRAFEVRNRPGPV
jgi:hypothetical protein